MAWCGPCQPRVSRPSSVRAPRSRKWRRLPLIRRRLVPGASGVWPVRAPRPTAAEAAKRYDRERPKWIGAPSPPNISAKPVEVFAQAGAVAGGHLPVVAEVGVEDRVQVQGPAVVVVEGPAVAVGVPAVAPVPGLHQLQGPLAGPRRLRVAAPHRLQETGDRVGEEVPVVGRGRVPQRAAQPLLRPVLYGGVEPFPQPGRRQPEAEGHGGRLDHRLALHVVVEDERPGLGVRRGPGCGCPP